MPTIKERLQNDWKAALKAKDDAYTKTVTDEFDAIQTEIYKYVDKDAALRPGRSLPLSDLEGIDALVKKINAFNYNYAGFMYGTRPKLE